MEPVLLRNEAGADEARQRTLHIGLVEAAALGDLGHRPCAQRDRREDAEPVLVREQADESRRIGHRAEA